MIHTQNIQGLEVITNQCNSSNAVLFIHGNSLDSSTFLEQINYISEILLIAISLPGHGNSDRPDDIESVYNIPGYVSSVIEVVEQLNVNNFILAGHSLGGHIALECLGLSSKIKGLLIFGAPPVSDVPDFTIMYHPNPNLQFLYLETIEEKALKSLSNAMINSNEKISNQLESIILKSDPRVRSNLAKSIGMGLFKNEVKLINHSTIPIAIFHGEDDTIVNENYLQQLNKTKLWENKIHLIKNAGHCPQLESSEKFNQLLKRFYSFVFDAYEKK